jgi:hypothetical protein
MMFRCHSIITWTVVLFYAAGAWNLSAQEKNPSGAFSRIVSAEVQGLVFYEDGATPAANVPVRVWDTDQKEFIYETQTDENGYFTLPKFEPGIYFLTFDWMKLELIVTEAGKTMVQQPHDVIVIIPRGLGFMSVNQLVSILTASTISEMAVMYQREWQPAKIVSP